MFPWLDAKETGDNGPLEVGRKDPFDAERAEERSGIADRDPFEDNDRDDSGALVKHPSQTASTVYVRTPFYSFPRKEREKLFCSLHSIVDIAAIHPIQIPKVVLKKGGERKQARRVRREKRLNYSAPNLI